MGRRIRFLSQMLLRSFKGIETPFAVPLFLAEFVAESMGFSRPRWTKKANYRRFILKYKQDEFFDFGGIKLPVLPEGMEKNNLIDIFQLSIVPYLFYNNTFPISLHRLYDYHVHFFGIDDELFEVKVKPGDVVIDAGAWIGDFAAYAIKVGASSVFAFEPFPDTYDLLTKTSLLNDGIVPVNLGLSDKDGKAEFQVHENSESNTFLPISTIAKADKVHSIDLQTTTLDNFAKANNIKKIDFIKADIEGFERYMLKGAKHVLKEFAPQLAICTYHLPDDEEMLRGLILDANANYKFFALPQILFARI